MIKIFTKSYKYFFHLSNKELEQKLWKNKDKNDQKNYQKKFNKKQQPMKVENKKN